MLELPGPELPGPRPFEVSNPPLPALPFVDSPKTAPGELAVTCPAGVLPEPPAPSVTAVMVVRLPATVIV